jgi:hypothetical protein
MVHDAGREPGSIEVTLFGMISDDADSLKRFAELGVTRVVPMLPPQQAETVLPLLDRWASLMRQVSQ